MLRAGNSASGEAAVVSITSSVVTVTGSTLSGNNADQHGGALLQNEGTLKVVNSRCGA